MRQSIALAFISFAVGYKRGEIKLCGINSLVAQLSANYFFQPVEKWQLGLQDFFARNGQIAPFGAIDLWK